MQKSGKKVFIIQREFIPSKGGDSRRIDELAFMLSSNFDVKIISTSLCEDKSPLGNCIIKLKANPLNFISRWIFSLKIIFLILKEKPETIYINAPYLEISILVFFSKILKIKTIINMTLMGQDGPFDLLNKTKYPKFLAKLFLYFIGKSDYILSLGTGLAKQAIEYGWEKEKIKVLYPSKDPKIYHPAFGKEEKANLRRNYGFRENEFLVCFIGYLVPRKGFQDLVFVWQEISKEIKEAKLLVAGSMREKYKIWAEDQLSKLEKGSFIYFGAVPREKVADILRISDLFVFPTYLEGLGAVLIEAMMSGIPIITTNLDGSTADLIRNGENGLLINPGDPVALKSAILKIYNDKNLRENLAKNAYEASKEFWEEEAKKKYLEIFS